VSNTEKRYGPHRLATLTIPIPEERGAIAAIQAERQYRDWDAINEAADLGLLRARTRHALLSPTFRCSIDCGGCPDRVSLHLTDPPEGQISLEEWRSRVDRLIGLGVEYFLLLGGTIDNHPATPFLMREVLSRPAPVDVGWYTDGIMLQQWKTGELTRLYHHLITEGGMLSLTTHISADYLVPEGTRDGGQLLDPSISWDTQYGDSRYYKSAFGERLARRLVEAHAKRIVLNTAVAAQNLDHVVPIYNYVAELQEYAQRIGSPTAILHTFSPWVWRPHLARGDNPGNFDRKSQLSEAHRNGLDELTRWMLADTNRRIRSGRPRVTGNSSGFIEGFPEFAIHQDIPYDHGSGEFAVEPNGTVRMDPIFVSARMLSVARCPYGYRDRDTDHSPFAQFDRRPPEDRFQNLIQSTRAAN
jgi:hypothetical protein